MMPKTYQDLIGLTKDDLVKLYDQEAPSVAINVNFIVQEIWRRDADRVNRRMERMTRYILWPQEL